MADLHIPPAPGTVLPGADILTAGFPAGAVVALRVGGVTYPWQRRERRVDGRWLPPVNPKAAYEVIVADPAVSAPHEFNPEEGRRG